MMLFLTGALDSLAKTTECPQTDPAKSLGGYVSSTPVPNGAINALFDLISQTTLAERPKETIAIGLINKLTQAVTGVELRIVVGKENIAAFKVAAVALDANMAMDSIVNRNQEPYGAEFYDATFQRASVDIEIKSPASAGEVIVLQPFNVTINVSDGGIEGTWEAFEDAFLSNNTYDVIRVSEKVFRIVRRDETVVTLTNLSYTKTLGFTMDYKGIFKNDATGSVQLTDTGQNLAPGAGIGLWLQRIIKSSNRYKTNEQLIEDWKAGIKNAEVEEVDVVISYSLVTPNQEQES